MKSVNTPEILDINTPFPSLAVLRAEHGKLLKQHRGSGETSDFLVAVKAFIEHGRATGAVLDDEDDRWTAQSLLDYWGATLYHPGQHPFDTTLLPFDSRLDPALSDDGCPYRGLEAFQEEHARLFFGRQSLIESMVEHLKTNRFLAVTGPSGSGTSSLVRAGLIPALKAGDVPESNHWRYLPVIRPGTMPLTRLLGLLNETGHAREQQPASATVLVIDQFEEIFTLCTDELQQQGFVAKLRSLLRSSGPTYRIILTMRCDFEKHIEQLASFYPLFEAARVYVPPPGARELRQAIEKPAERVGLKFAPGIVEALLHDTVGEPAALPLLQFTLLKLWEERQGNCITWEAYRRVGGGRQALIRSADAFYHNLSSDEQGTARQIMLRLVRPGEGDQVTSHRICLDVLYRGAEDAQRVDRVLEGLMQAHLVRLTEGDTPAEIQVEVIHEALATTWPLLARWLGEVREHLRQRQRLTVAADQWQRVGRDKDALLRGALLAEALRYDDLTALEQEFVSASRAVENDRATALTDDPPVKKDNIWRRRILVLAIILAVLVLVPFGLWAQRPTETVDVPVQVTIAGAPPPGFTTGRPAVDIQEVKISGTAHRVGQVAIVRALAQLPETSTDFESALPLQAIDNTGQPVEGVAIEPATVSVEVPIYPLLQLKRVPIVADITDVTAPGYIITEIRTDPAFVNISSDNGSDAIANVAQIKTAPVDVTNATSSITRDVELLLPPGVALQSGEPSQVNVTVQVEALNPRFQVQLQVELTGVDNRLAYQVNPVLATLEGTAEEFMSLDPDPIVAKVDVSERGAGNYQLIPTIEGLPPAIRVVAVDSAAVVLIAAASPTHTRTVTPSPSAWPTITLTSTPSSTPASTLTTTPTVVTSTPTATPTSTLTVTLTPSTTLTITPTIATTETITTTPPTTPDPTQSETTSTTPAGNAETATPDESPSTPTMPSSTTEVPSETPTPISLTEPTQEALPPSPTTESDNLEESSTD